MLTIIPFMPEGVFMHTELDNTEPHTKPDKKLYKIPRWPPFWKINLATFCLGLPMFHIFSLVSEAYVLVIKIRWIEEYEKNIDFYQRLVAILKNPRWRIIFRLRKVSDVIPRYQKHIPRRLNREFMMKETWNKAFDGISLPPFWKSKMAAK